MTTAILDNQQFHLAARPVGMVKSSDWEFISEPVRNIADSEILVEVLYLSISGAAGRDRRRQGQM